MNVLFITLGCKVNQIESEAMRELLLENGFTSDKTLPADVYVINSCTVTGESDKKTRRLLSSAKKENPNALIVLTGCLPQAFPEKAEALGADIVTGTKNRAEILRLIKEAEKVVKIEKHLPKEEFENMEVQSFSEHTRAFMKIQDGCDRFCTYCIIPYARGHLRSKSLEGVLKSASTLSENGYKEITLTGINLSYYGKSEKVTLADAVLAAATPDGVKRIRLGSLQPDLIDEKMIKAFKNEEKFCPQFHLSLQSGSSSVLKRMNRPYTAEDFKNTVSLIRSYFNDASITTDIIVGFPGETEEEFSETLELVKDVEFLKVHVFPYSRRTGTPAAEMTDQVPTSVKNERKRRLIALCEDIRRKILTEMIGKTEEVLIETSKKGGCAQGYTKNYVPVTVNESIPAGEIAKVRIDAVKNGECFGVREGF